MPRLEFDSVHSYSAQAEGIGVPVVLKHGLEVVDFLAFIDTGATNCLFQRAHGELLGLEIEIGVPKTFWTATGRVETFGHMVTLEVHGLSVESFVYFFADEQIHKNLLGRIGWLDRVRFGLVEYDQVIYLAPYDAGQI
jgi:predicted aspartyl protease